MNKISIILFRSLQVKWVKGAWWNIRGVIILYNVYLATMGSGAWWAIITLGRLKPEQNGGHLADGQYKFRLIKLGGFHIRSDSPKKSIFNNNNNNNNNNINYNTPTLPHIHTNTHPHAHPYARTTQPGLCLDIKPIFSRHRDSFGLIIFIMGISVFQNRVSSFGKRPSFFLQGPLLLTWFNFNPSMDK